MSFCAKNLPHRQAEKRWLQYFMKRIKVKPDFFPIFEGKTTYADGTEVKHESFEKKENELSNELIMIFKDENNIQKILKLKGLDLNGEKFVSSVPNPVFLLLNTSIDNYNSSNSIIAKFKEAADKIGEKTYFFELDDNYTSQIFNTYLSNKIASINSLINCLEIFINQKIPNNYTFKRTIKDREVSLNKSKIESSLSFKEKISNMLPDIFQNLDFNQIVNDINLIFEAYNLRKETIHMKTGSDSPFEQYYEIMGKILEANIEPYISSSINFINFIHKDLIEFNNGQ